MTTPARVQMTEAEARQFLANIASGPRPVELNYAPNTVALDEMSDDDAQAAASKFFQWAHGAHTVASLNQSDPALAAYLKVCVAAAHCVMSLNRRVGAEVWNDQDQARGDVPTITAAEFIAAYAAAVPAHDRH